METVLGRGGMGVVYGLVCRSTGRRAALKVMHSAMLGFGNSHQRFEREIEILGRLNHPGIVRLLESGELQGRCYFLMDRVEGHRLDEALRPGTEAPSRIAEIVADIAAALEHAHARGLIHRDIKPANLMLTSDGRAALLDFGLARALAVSASARLTSAGQSRNIGTRAYIPPERLLSNGDDAGPSSDVYSLAVVAHELLIGRLPVPGVVPSRLRDGLSRRYDEVFAKGLHADPAQRYPTAPAFAEALGVCTSAHAPAVRPVLVSGHRRLLCAAVMLAAAGVLAAAAFKGESSMDCEASPGVLVPTPPRCDGGALMW